MEVTINSVKWTSKLLNSIRQGCVCHVSNEEYANYLFAGCLALRNNGGRHEILCFLTYLRAFTKFSMIAASTCCRRIHTWLIILRKMKIFLLRGLVNLVNNTTQDQHMSNLALNTFSCLLALIPCPVIRMSPESSCLRICSKINEHFLKTQSDLSTSLAKTSLIDIESWTENVKEGLKMSCTKNASVTLVPGLHYKNFNVDVLQHLKNQWKLTWMMQDNVKDNLTCLTLWKSLVDVKSNMTLHQAREFVSSIKFLIDKIPDESNALVKRKWLEIFNEVLCYGSTLGIQSDVPSEVSEISHQIVRQAKSIPMDEFVVPHVHLGLGGSRIVTEEDEKVPDLVILQGLILIHLKSMALLVREAQSCSSSDESDSSLSSRGSSSIAEEDQEMKMIEKNVVQILLKLKIWINDTLGLPSSNSLNSGIVTLFNDQDDAMIEALLCLLDTHSGLQFGSYSARISMIDNYQEDINHESMDFFNPIDAFEEFLNGISHDSSVLLDFLVSNETCFLLYFLRMLKYLNKVRSASTIVLTTLKKVQLSIKKLTDKSLFPYDIRPVLKQLEKLTEENI